MSLSGTGIVKAKPDEGYITVGVVTRAEKSADAVAENTKLMKALFKAVKEKGVKDEGLNTVEFSVRENHKTVWGPKDEKGQQEAKTVKDGYIVTNTVDVTVCDLAKFGEVLDAVTSSGANKIHSIAFGSSKAKVHLAEARKLAVAEALKKAKDLTEGLGVSPGRVLSISEYEQDRGEGRRLYAAAPMSRDSAVPVSGGSLSFTVNVSVKWELNQNQKKGCCGCGVKQGQMLRCK